MPRPKSCSDRDFIHMFTTLGPRKTAERLGISPRRVFRRRRNIEVEHKTPVKPPNHEHYPQVSHHPERIKLEVKNGTVIVGSDAHYWPGPPTLAHLAFVKFIKEFKPSVVIMNGDATDFPKISRHPRIGWDHNPEVADEIESAKDRMHEVAVAAGKARKIWPCGNHDARYETRLATVAPEYVKVHGTSLSDHFPLWEPCWSVWINDSVVVKHRYKGGIHGGHNNTLWAGKTTVTGHTHQLKVSPLPDYNGVRWGIETGCLADPYGPQFVDYTEDNPRMWQAGFVVLTFHQGTLLYPEVVRVHDDKHVDFRGKLIKI